MVNIERPDPLGSTLRPGSGAQRGEDRPGGLVLGDAQAQFDQGLGLLAMAIADIELGGQPDQRDAPGKQFHALVDDGEVA